MTGRSQVVIVVSTARLVDDDFDDGTDNEAVRARNVRSAVPEKRRSISAAPRQNSPAAAPCMISRMVFLTRIASC